jgi:hypothetical protein
VFDFFQRLDLFCCQDADEEHVAMPPFGRSDAEWADVAAFYRCSGTSVIFCDSNRIFKYIQGVYCFDLCQELARVLLKKGMDIQSLLI